MNVEIWADLICPWCYIGKRNFETAVRQAGLENTFQIAWRSFELDPHAPREESRPLVERLAEKYRLSPEQAAERIANVTSAAAQAGLRYRLDIARPGNTFDAHRLVHLATARGLGKQLMERLMRGYFSEGLPIGNHAALTQAASECGLDESEVLTLLAGNIYAAEVRADEKRALRLNIRSVPCFVFDEHSVIHGAQPVENFLNAFRQLTNEKA